MSNDSIHERRLTGLKIIISIVGSSFLCGRFLIMLSRERKLCFENKKQDFEA